MHALLQSLLHQIALFLQAHSPSIAVGIVSTVLAIFGGNINRRIRKTTKGFPFLARFSLFVFLCSFGYAFLSSQSAKLLRDWMRTLPDPWLVGFVAGIFLLLGFLARSGKDV